MGAVMRYVASSKQGHGPLIAMPEDLPNMVVPKEAALPVEYGVKGRELEQKLYEGIETFIRDMELQGLTLIPMPQGNPIVVRDSHGEPVKGYSHHKNLERTTTLPGGTDIEADERDGSGPSTLQTPTSLDDSDGLVDYLIVGVFWAPQVSVEIAVERERILEQERAAKNPRTWGGGKSTPNTPSIST